MRMLRSLCSGPIARRNEAYIALGAGSWACQLEGRGGEQSAGWGGGRPRPPGKPRRDSEFAGGKRPSPVLPAARTKLSGGGGRLSGLRPSGCVPPRAESSWPRRALLFLPVLGEPFFLREPSESGASCERGFSAWNRGHCTSQSQVEAGRRPERRELGERRTWDEGRGLSFTLEILRNARSFVPGKAQTNAVTNRREDVHAERTGK